MVPHPWSLERLWGASVECAVALAQFERELCKDMLTGAALLRWMLDQAMPVMAIEIEIEVVLPNGL